MDEKTLARFFSKVDKNGPVLVEELGPCHVWRGANRQGYGQFWLDGKLHYAHRVAFLIANGRLPEPQGLHRCDGGPIGCVRADHIFEGTISDNVQDMLRKGRANTWSRRRGVERLEAKVNEDQVREIRRRRLAGSTLKVLAHEYGLCIATVYEMCARKTWKHIA